MKPVAFDYIRASSIDEVTDALAEFGPDAVVLAGGMSLGPMLNMRLVRPSVVIDIGRLSCLQSIETDDNLIRVGAGVRQTDAMSDDALAAAVPLLAEAMPHVGHYQTRSRGTLGGSVCHADPSAEIPLALLVCGGEVELASRTGRRRIGGDNFFRGLLSTARRPDEVATATIWPRQSGRQRFAFGEFSQRHGDFAVAAAACALEVSGDGKVETLRLGLGGVEDRPILVEVSQFEGGDAGEELVEAVSEHAARSVEPLEDITASADYRRALAATLSAQVLREAMA